MTGDGVLRSEVGLAELVNWEPFAMWFALVRKSKLGCSRPTATMRSFRGSWGQSSLECRTKNGLGRTGYLQAFAHSNFLTNSRIEFEADSSCFITRGDGFASVWDRISRVDEVATFGYLMLFGSLSPINAWLSFSSNANSVVVLRCKSPQSFTEGTK